jgi:2-iminobutanoate/2-iminopropanoate deaminase
MRASQKIRIQTNAAPPALGSYSQAIRVGNLVFVTGQTGRNPNTGKLLDGVEAQARQAMDNVAAVLNAAGCSPAGIIRSNLVLADIKDFALVDEVYVRWLPDDRIVCHPARTVFQAKALPAGALVMLDVIAAYPS